MTDDGLVLLRQKGDEEVPSGAEQGDQPRLEDVGKGRLEHSPDRVGIGRSFRAD